MLRMAINLTSPAQATKSPISKLPNRQRRSIKLSKRAEEKAEKENTAQNGASPVQELTIASPVGKWWHSGKKSPRRSPRFQSSASKTSTPLSVFLGSLGDTGHDHTPPGSDQPESMDKPMAARLDFDGGNTIGARMTLTAPTPPRGKERRGWWGEEALAEGGKARKDGSRQQTRSKIMKFASSMLSSELGMKALKKAAGKGLNRYIDGFKKLCALEYVRTARPRCFERMQALSSRLVVKYMNGEVGQHQLTALMDSFDQAGYTIVAFWSGAESFCLAELTAELSLAVDQLRGLCVRLIEPAELAELDADLKFFSSEEMALRCFCDRAFAETFGELVGLISKGLNYRPEGTEHGIASLHERRAAFEA